MLLNAKFFLGADFYWGFNYGAGFWLIDWLNYSDSESDSNYDSEWLTASVSDSDSDSDWQTVTDRLWLTNSDWDTLKFFIIS